MKFESVPGKSAFEAAVKSIRSRGRLVVVGSEEGRMLAEDHIEQSGAQSKAAIKAALRISAPEWFKEGIEKFIVVNDVEIGKWPKKVRSKRDWHLDKEFLSKTILDDVIVAKISVESSWQIPAIFCFGGGNDCPPPETHCAVWKYWEDHYDCHIVGISHDVIEAKVFSPPDSQERALSLAKEQYVYCGDIVSQGVGSIADLAASLLNADKWFFWWD